MTIRSWIASSVVALAGAAPALAQFDRVTTDAGTQDPGVWRMTQAYSVAACSDGAAFTGGVFGNGEGINLLRVKSSGAVAWERQYSVPPLDNGGYGGDVEVTSDGGFVIAAITNIPGDDQYNPAYRLGILKVDSVGQVQWGAVTKAVSQIAPVAYKQWDCPRVRELPDGSFVAISNTTVPGVWCGDQEDIDVGVLFRVDAHGTPIYSHFYGELGTVSRVAFTDLAVNETGIFVVGTIMTEKACDCSDDRDGLIAWFDFNGNPIAAWGIDSPIDPLPSPECPNPASSEWGCGLALKGMTAYVSFTDVMPYGDQADALVGSFDLSSGAFNWSNTIKNFYPLYHCVALNSSGQMQIAGRYDDSFSGFHKPAFALLNGGTGAILAARYYTDPRIPLADSLQDLRGVAPAFNSDKTWLVNGPAYSSPSDVYYMFTSPSGDSECASHDLGLGGDVPLKVNDRVLKNLGDLGTLPWTPVMKKVKSKEVDPCH